MKRCETVEGEIFIRPVARIRSDFSEKFGIPRQSGIVETLKARIVFEPEFRNPDALRGMEGFSHLWLIGEFSAARRDGWSATVRPPRLGGNTRMGVFATRSPFRPNPLGLSCVKLESIDFKCADAPVITVSGADLMDGTPIYDIKPYLPYCDCKAGAVGGFASEGAGHRLELSFPYKLMQLVPADKREALTGVLEADPRPSYQHDPDRVYGMSFGGLNVKFKVSENTLTVIDVSAEN
ncbi:MAG: tRNA (N6-threonylcarbamoyladenosine(37)-N6)-methyltransferase TrmO [Oscillospiraceae bacterium]|nr:tRNA (N6-threonylcarbamoyladenosine(37)-N6)-methyltransferase TrmO [Oscillospiraceae bacterium]